MAPDSKLLAALQAELARHPEVRLAVLFGSQAKGTAHAGSDVDLAVLGRPGFDTLTLGAQLARTVHREVDVVDLEQVDHVLLGGILRGGVKVYEAERGLCGDWLGRAITTYELDELWFRPMQEAFLKRLADRRHG